MHELPFVMKLLEETDALAREMGLSRIVRLKAAVGELSGIEPECVSLYFESASEGRAAEGAELEIEVRPAKLTCGKCGCTFDHDPAAARKIGRDPFDCPQCGGPGVLVRGSGSGMELVSVEGS